MTAREVVMRSLETARGGDWAGALEYVHPEAVGHVPGRSSWAGDLHGREAFSDYISHARALSADADVEVELEDVLASDTRVALLVREVFHREGGDTIIRRANVYRVEGEQIVEVTIYEHDQYAVDALFGD
jgi:ketosteroid isomerase-like protein